MSKNTAAIDAAKRKEKRNSILITVAVVLVAALVIGLVVYNSLSTSGFITRRQVAAATENYTVTGSMLTYFFHANYNQNASSMTAYGLNPNVSLKSQVFEQSTGTTWFDYFASMTISYVQELLAMCEAAHANGVALEEADYAVVEENMTAMRTAAESYGYSMENYLLAMFGSVVNEDDVRACLEMNTLALKYYRQYSDSLEYGLEDYEEYYNANKTAYDCVDVITYTVKNSDLIETDEAGNPIGNITDATAKAKEQADLIAAAKTEEEFVAAVKNYLMTTPNLSKTEEEADEIIAKCYQTGMTATKGNAASDWAFTAEAGDTTVVNAAASSSYDVYYMLKPSYRDDSATRNVRHILLTVEANGDEAEAKAQSVYAMWEESGFNMDTFTTLCAQYSEDPGSQTTGGVYENVARGEMITEFNDWLFDEARVEGDKGLVETAYGWHIMYYDGEGLPAWQTDADNALRQKAYTDMITEYASVIEVNEKVLNGINA